MISPLSASSKSSKKFRQTFQSQIVQKVKAFGSLQVSARNPSRFFLRNTNGPARMAACCSSPFQRAKIRLEKQIAIWYHYYVVVCSFLCRTAPPNLSEPPVPGHSGPHSSGCRSTGSGLPGRSNGLLQTHSPRKHERKIKEIDRTMKLGIGGDRPDFITSYIFPKADKACCYKHFQKNQPHIIPCLSTHFHTEMA